MDFDYDSNHFSNDIELKDAKDEDHANAVEDLEFNGNGTNCFTVEPHTNINFNSVEWGYLQIAQQSLHHSASQNTGLEISPSISNHTLQSMKPAFSAEYDTDNTDLLGILDSQNPSNFNLSENQNCVSSDSLLNTSTSTYKANHEFTFEHHLDSTYWECLLEKENMLHDGDDILNVNTSGKAYVEDNDGNSKAKNSKDGDIQSAVCSTSTIEDEDLIDNSFHYNQDDSIMQCNSNDEAGDLCPEEECVWDERLSYEGQAHTERGANFFSDPIALQLSVASPRRTRAIVQPRTSGEKYITTSIYEWPDDETTGSTQFYNKMKIRLSTLEPKCVSDAVLKTVRAEFVIQDLFLNGQSPPSPEIPESIKKRSDKDVEWTPLSVYKAYTNIKSPTNGKESYNRLVPYSSCIGTLNYRPKDHAAWKRAPNRRQ
ncbi:hypothetical protein CANMA_001522 [Candida margitis]|uniref:uncharacterized protein n=1 Tax=Candida margitis TaxID=1775924 RepID=UPI00222677B5|nr:uncharacterized protein CANMA_001522 [Candida margitis]KAI5969454.1 hypothetical protein CANMA_001522 [Candida margitis]